MSVSNLLTPNNFELFAKKITVDETTSDIITTTDYVLPTYGLFNGSNNSPLNVAITMRYNYTGVCTLFYDGSTDSSLLAANASSIKIGTASNQYTLTGLPEIRGLVGARYSHILTLLINGVQSLAILNLEKISSTQFTLTFTRSDGSVFPTGQTFGITPFTFDFIVQE